MKQRQYYLFALIFFTRQNQFPNEEREKRQNAPNFGSDFFSELDPTRAHSESIKDELNLQSSSVRFPNPTKPLIKMAEEAAAAAPVVAKKAPKTPKTPKAKGEKKPNAAATHPPTASMVKAAIKALKERNGSSLPAIKKYIAAEYKVDTVKLAPFIKKAIKTLVEKKALVQTKGKGASGSFKLAAAEKKEKKVKAPKKKAAAKKPKGEKKVKTPKKKAAAKKPKTPKAKAEKKPKAAAKPKAEKKPKAAAKPKAEKKPKAAAKPKAEKKAKTPKKAAPKKAAPKKAAAPKK